MAVANDVKVAQAILSQSDMDQVYQSIEDLNKADLREEALKELSKRRENVPDLAPLLWHSPGAIAALLQEICAVYYYISPANLTAVQSNRVCNALALLQVLAAHPDTRSQFLHANIPLYLYPFLNTHNQSRPFEYLRLTSLGVIGTLVKTDEPEVIAFLLGSGIIPHCLLIMENGSELSRTVATFIMEKLLLDDYGLQYICQTFDRFKHVASILSQVVAHLAQEPSGRLLKHVVRCYLRLSDHQNARVQLTKMLPHQLMDNTFQNWLEKDVSTKRWLSQFIRTIHGGAHNPPGTSIETSNHGALEMTHSGMNLNPVGDSRPGSFPGGTNLSGGTSN